MAINTDHLRLHIVRPTLEYLNLWSQSAEDLLLGTAAQESAMGTFLVQLNGPALGIYQMEPKTWKDIYENYLNYREPFREKVDTLRLQFWTDPLNKDGLHQILGNLYYATALARVHYLRVPEALPIKGENLEGEAHADYILSLARYWKRYYNTPLGRGTEEEFIDNYKRYVLND